VKQSLGEGGSKLDFDTDCGKIGILISYDVEFPELGRLLADEGMDIFVCSILADTQMVIQGSKLRAGESHRMLCCHCGSVEIASSPIWTSIMRNQWYLRLDFAFPTNGVKTETTTNSMILIADVDIDS
jgi:predicted amidohydrolase